MQDPLPVWVAVGGTPQSVVRAGALGLPLALAIIGGEPERFAPLVDAATARPRGEAGHDPASCRSASTRTASSPTPRRRRPTSLLRRYAEVMNRIGRERGWPPMSRAPVRRAAGAARRAARRQPEEVAEKILFQHELFGHERFLMQIGVGALPHREVLRSIELLGTEVAPLVRAELARRAPAVIGG